MVIICLRKGERIPSVTPQPLSQGVIPAFHMRGFTGFLTDLLMCLVGEALIVGSPEIAVGTTKAISIRNPAPQLATGSLAVVAKHKGDVSGGCDDT